MKIHLKDAPDILFDQDKWLQFCSRFADKNAALSAISRPPAAKYGYHDDDDVGLPELAEARWSYVDETFRLGNELVGVFKRELISGELDAWGVIYHLDYQPGEDGLLEIPAGQWQRLWPIFDENEAMGGERYVQVHIHWDERRKRETAALEDMIVSFLAEHKSDGLLKKELAAMVGDRFPDVPVRLFNRCYGRVFKRKRGRPRRLR